MLNKVKESAHHAGGSLYNLIDKRHHLLTEWRRDGSPRMKAAAAALLAHLARIHWKKSKERDQLGARIRFDEVDALELLKEAVGHEPSAIRFIELAEYVAAEGDKREAQHLLEHARELAPLHPVPRLWLSG
jgi:hypothetical protein